jgi:thioredoxin-related protein
MLGKSRFFAPLFAAAFILISANTVRAQEIHWRSDYNAALAEAAAAGKPLLVDFGTQACFYCKKLDDTTFHVPMVAKLLNERFIPVKVDAGRNPRLARELGISSFPTLVLASADGKILDQQVGFCEAPRLTSFLQQAVARATPASVANPEPRTQARMQIKEERAPAQPLAIDEPAKPLQTAVQERTAEPRAMFQLPAPEELGLTTVKATPEVAPIDWTAVHARLDKLGATSFQVQRESPESVRLSCLIPMAAERVHRIDVTAATEAAAARLFMAQVDEWAAADSSRQ